MGGWVISMEHEEISLKELIIITLKGWKWIISVTLTTTIVAVVFTLGIKPIVYESNSSFNIMIPANDITEYNNLLLCNKVSICKYHHAFF